MKAILTASMKPEDRSKTIALIVLCIAFLGITGWRAKNISGSGESGAKQAPVTIGTLQKKATEVETAGPPVDAPKHSNRDPFSGSVDTSSPISEKEAAIPPPLKPPIKPAKSATDVAPHAIPSQQLPAVGEHGSIAIGQAELPIQVMGVITGQSGVAILFVGDQKVVVKVGDTFGKNLRLISVTVDQVVVLDGTKQRIFSTVGD